MKQTKAYQFLPITHAKSSSWELLLPLGFLLAFVAVGFVNWHSRVNIEANPPAPLKISSTL